MATERALTHTLRLPNNTVWPGQTVTFTLLPSVQEIISNVSNIYPVASISEVSNNNGVVNVSLVPGSYLVLFPGGERYRIQVPTEAEQPGTLQLVDLLEALPTVMDDERWGAYKEALLEYSAYRPRIVPGTLSLAVGSKLQSIPQGVTSIEFLDYGQQFTLAEVHSAAADSTDQGWAFAQGRLYLTPAPATAGEVAVIYRMLHVADEYTRTAPTLAPSDYYAVEQLTEANLLISQQTAVNLGLASYTLGSTTVKWAQEAGGSPNTLGAGEKLKARILASLGEPVADWA